jgi:hypothetical protein
MGARLMLAGMAMLALAGILINFAGILFDAVTMGGAVFLALKVDQQRRAENTQLAAENIQLRADLSAERRDRQALLMMNRAA